MLVASTATRAHPPHAPFLNFFGEDSKFAPITRFGPKVSVEVVASGMTAPLKGVTAPGVSRYLFVVDQPGIVWAVDLQNHNPEANKTKFLDLTKPAVPPHPGGDGRRIVQLGVCGPDSFDERGLLGIAFAPDFQKSGKFYTYTSERRDRPDATTIALPTPGTTPLTADHHNVVAEWTANPANLTAEVSHATRREILHANWPQFNHDGGDLAFGPDGMLYISMGDGGGADDADGQPFVNAPPHYLQDTNCSQATPIFGHQNNGNGQKLNTTLGKILRIDVSGISAGKQYRVPSSNPFVNNPAAVPEIWALGFRNPYRFSFDRKTGELYVGDVGQNDIEEVDIVKRGSNFGWNCKEGTAFFYINGSAEDDGFADESPNRAERPGDCTSGPRPFIDPIAQHDTHREGHSVIGGFVYHGKRAPVLRGKYVFGDFSLLFKFPSGPHDYGRLFSVNARSDGHGLRKISELIVVPGGALSLALLGIGQDASGEVYVMGNIFGVPFGNAGRVLRLVEAEDAHGDKDDDDDDD